MPKLEVYFDYACPYCYHGLEYLRELLPGFMDIELVWFPCEAHPRPERYGIHSDIAIQGFCFAMENGASAWEYNDRVFKAVFEERANIETTDTVAKCLDGLGLSGKDFLLAEKQGKYADHPHKNNRAAWEKCRFDAVPSYQMNGGQLRSKDGVAVTKEMLRSFLCRYGATASA